MWATPAGRQALDLHFKLLRAAEERIRLNVEIKRLATWMKEEKDFLVHHEQRLAAAGDEVMALQMRKYRMLKGRFFGLHRQRLERLQRVSGFTGSIDPGVGVCKIRRAVLTGIPLDTPVEDPAPEVTAALTASAAQERAEHGGDDDGGAEDTEDITDDEAELDDGFQAVLKLIQDDSQVPGNEIEQEE
jgi:hypothetical protein